MDQMTEEVLQNAGALEGAVEKHKAKMVESGFEETVLADLTAARDDLVDKGTKQDKAVELVLELTTTQNTVVESKRTLIAQVKTAARSAYGKKPDVLKLFHIGIDVPESEKKICSECDYLFTLVNERKSDFLKNAFTQVLIDSLMNGRKDVEDADLAQENAKKAQKAATIIRNQSLSALNEIMFKIRNFAKTCFAGQPEILVEFEPISVGGGGSNSPNPPTPPAQ